MTDEQPLKERREAEEAELFQKGGVRVRASQEKEMLTKEDRAGFVLIPKSCSLTAQSKPNCSPQLHLGIPFIHRGLFQLQVGLHTRHWSHVGG